MRLQASKTFLGRTAILRGAVCLVLLLASSFFVRAQEHANETPYRQLPGFPFVFISDESVTTPPEISDSLFDAVARGIRFKVNRTELRPDDPFISVYKDSLLAWLQNQDMELRQVFIKGAASPEGPYQNNVRLSRGRTRRLAEFLADGLGQKMEQSVLSESSVTEDYGLLVKMMKQAGDPDYPAINAIWEQSGGDEPYCKKHMMALDGGKVWKRLVKEYFPALRQARVILWFARKEDSQKKTPIVAEAISAQPVQQLLYSPQAALIAPPVQAVRLIERRHLIAARTNLLHDLLYWPQFGWAPGFNIQLEYYPLNGHYTANAGFTFINHRHWNQYKFFQIRDLQLEVRRYFRGGGLFTGPYLGLYAEGTVYGIGFGKTKGWEGEGGGGGLSMGWVWPLNRKGNLRLEVSASLGAFYTRFDPYIYGNPINGVEDGLYYYDYHGNTSDFRERNHQMFWFGPTNLGVHLTYDIIYRKWKTAGSYNAIYQRKMQEGGAR